MKTNFNGVAVCSALCALFAGGAHSATYYSQSAQNRYSPTGYNPAQQRAAQSQQYQQYQQYQRPGVQPQQQQSQQQQQQQRQSSSSQSQKGFYAGAGVSHESAVWQFSMNEAGSVLHYDNIGWNVADINAGYGFDAGNFGVKVDVGVKFGAQSGDSTMVDDDITNGGYLTNFYYEDKNGNGIYDTGDEFIGSVIGRALSIGKSSGGSLFGYNIGVGLTDMLQVGNVRITPSLGYRSLSYTLKTNRNNGLALEVLEGNGSCNSVPGSDETQCSPVFIIDPGGGGNLQLVWDGQSTTGGVIDTGNTYYYNQPGTSHKYEVDWSGPYLALDLDYAINANNAVNARVEVGLPAYEAIGDQGYRPDWMHPKSIEDSAGMGSAMHFGLGASWLTAITSTVSLSVGFAYDYYSISGATAKTYLNGTYYENLYWEIIDTSFGGSESAALADPGSPAGTAIQQILELESSCPRWVCTSKNEIDSFYRSMGIRLGVVAKF